MFANKEKLNFVAYLREKKKKMTRKKNVHKENAVQIYDANSHSVCERNLRVNI